MGSKPIQSIPMHSAEERMYEEPSQERPRDDDRPCSYRLLAICTGLCMAVFLVALVRRSLDRAYLLGD